MVRRPGYFLPKEKKKKKIVVFICRHYSAVTTTTPQPLAITTTSLDDDWLTNHYQLSHLPPTIVFGPILSYLLGSAYRRLRCGEISLPHCPCNRGRAFLSLTQSRSRDCWNGKGGPHTHPCSHRCVEPQGHLRLNPYDTDATATLYLRRHWGEVKGCPGRP